MKKIFGLMLALAAVSFVSCQKEGDNLKGSADVATVTLSVNLPQEIATKGTAGGDYAKDLYYEIYDAVTGNIYEKNQTEIPADALSLPLEFTLIRGVKYQIVFWAQADGAPYGISTEKGLQEISMNYDTNHDGNNELRDAFTGTFELNITDTDTDINIDQPQDYGTVELTRPFAQINFATRDYDAGLTFNGVPVSGFTVTNTTVSVAGVPKTYNAYTGEVGTETVDATFNATGAVDHDGDGTPDTFTKGSDNYTYIAMNYVLPTATNDALEVTASYTLQVTLENGNTAPAMPTGFSRTIPVKANYRTNVLGALFTEDGKIEVSVSPAFLGDNLDEVVD